MSALQDVLAALWKRAESNVLHPGSIRAKAQELMREHIADLRCSQRSHAGPQRRRRAAVRAGK